MLAGVRIRTNARPFIHLAAPYAYKQEHPHRGLSKKAVSATPSDARVHRQRVVGGAKRKHPGGPLRIPGLPSRAAKALGAGSFLKRRYELGGLLGRGRFGVVREAFDVLLKKKVAIKVLNKTRDKISCQTEVMIYSTLLDRLGGCKEAKKRLTLPIDLCETDSHLYIVMEYIGGGDLFDLIIEKGHFLEDEFKPLIHGIADSLFLLHSHGIIHRDIKPENILLRPVCNDLPPEPVCTDFGLSYILGKPDLLEKPAGTFGYVSPEILSAANKSRSLSSSMWTRGAASLESGYANDIKFSCDIWSLGVLCYASLCGELPFPASMDGTTTVEEHLQQVYAGPRFNSIKWDGVSKDVKSLIAAMLHYSPFNRPSLEYIRSHPWLKID